ncbi:serpin family protein [Endozoicomonas sp. ALE010]|uniref:serpin family protein n=1 Tax=Endozoicomonas sp. ALE010 TaxID=3403081 RepID=UPI003BB5E08B
MDAIPFDPGMSALFQRTNLPDTASPATLSASDIVKTMVDKLSLELLDIKGNKSKALSLVSLLQALGMALLSMTDDTIVASALGISPGSLTQDLKDKIHTELGKCAVKHSNDPDSDQSIRITNFIGSTFCYDNEQYEQSLSKYYKTKKLDNNNNGKNLADTIDSFVHDKTEGEIDTVFGHLTESQRHKVEAALGSVMNFQIDWDERFSEDDTEKGLFQCADGTFINNVLMMCKTEVLNVATDGNFAAIAKEFRSANGEDLKLVAIKPRKSSATAINNLNSETINHLIDKLKNVEMEVELKLPKIDITNSCNTELLDKINQVLGTSIKAQDLSKLGTQSDDQLHIVQKIKASINEKGARGSIATAAVDIGRSLFIDPICFDFNCPGYIAIVDREGNRLLELVIKDGQFLVHDGPPMVTDAENCNSYNQKFFKIDDLSDDEDNTPDNKCSEYQADNKCSEYQTYNKCSEYQADNKWSEYQADNKWSEYQGLATQVVPSYDTVLPLLGNNIELSDTKDYETRLLPQDNRQLQKDLKTSIESPTASVASQKVLEKAEPASQQPGVSREQSPVKTPSPAENEKLPASAIDNSSKHLSTGHTPSTIDEFSELLSANPLKIFDVSTLIKNNFKPNEDFNIKSAEAGRSSLTIKVKHEKNAIKIRERILESIGEKHSRNVKIWENFDPVHVDVMFDAWKALQNHLSSS